MAAYLLKTEPRSKGPHPVNRSIRILIAALAVVAIAVVVIFVVAKPRPTTPAPSSEPTGAASATPAPAATWLSGASGDLTPTGEFGDWRGDPVGIAGTWADDNKNMVQFYNLQPGGAYADWQADLDIAIGAIGDGETWAAAATGAYDDRWTESLEKLKAARASSPGQTFIRFAHEMNGNWYPWKVTADNYQDFDTAWARFRALQQQIYPESKLVFNVNRESVDTGMDWRNFFPGGDQVDVLSVDYYNQYPYVANSAEWDSAIQETDKWGAPKGLAQHLAFAKSVGLPFAISEWSGNADNGDSPMFVDELLGFVQANAGTGPGQIEYEILFNVPQDDGRWLLTGEGARMPASADAYKKFFEKRG